MHLYVFLLDKVFHEILDSCTIRYLMIMTSGDNGFKALDLRVDGKILAGKV